MSISQQDFFQLLDISGKLAYLVDRSSEMLEQLLHQEPQKGTQKSTQSTLWIGDWGSAQLTSVQLQETAQWLILTIAIPNVTAEELDIQVSAETVLIQGVQQEIAEVENYCCCSYVVGHFQSLIPLPCGIYPEIIEAELENEVLTLKLAKAGKVFRQGVKFSLKSSATPVNYLEPANAKSS